MDTAADRRTPAVEEIVDLTKDLIRFRSTHTRPAETRQCAESIDAWLKARALPSVYLETNGVPSICVPPPEGGPRLLLMSHIDVVDGPDSLFAPVVKDGRLYGRGAIDDKYAAALSMVLLHRHGAAGRHPDAGRDPWQVGLLITGDEEVGGAHGARQALQGLTCDFCIALDGGSLEKIVVKEKGVLRLKLTAGGKTAHGARPWQGDNAIARLMEDCLHVKGFFDGLEAPDHWHRTMNLAIVRGGRTVNQVPDQAEAIYDIRYTEHDDVDGLIRQIQAAVSSQVAVLDREPLFLSPGSPHLEGLLTLAGGTRTGIAHGASDARFLTQFGIPGIVWGANGNSSQHTDAEHVEIESISRLYDILNRFVSGRTGSPPS